MATSGPFSPFPVRTQTTLEPGGTSVFDKSAAEAAAAGSQKTDSFSARKWKPSGIWSSATALIASADSQAAPVAPARDAGLPIRIAVATVSGLSIRWPSTIGAAPAA